MSFKRSELSFLEGFTTTKGMDSTSVPKTFNWAAAAEIIKEERKQHSDLVAEAGLQGDWNYTNAIIFQDGNSCFKDGEESSAHLSSNWAIPTLILSWDNKEQKEIECWLENTIKYDAYSKWDEESLQILNN